MNIDKSLKKPKRHSIAMKFTSLFANYFGNKKKSPLFKCSSDSYISKEKCGN